MERDRQELRHTRQRVEALERAVLRRRGKGEPTPIPPPGGPSAGPLPEETSGGRPESKGPKARDKNLKNLFARIFSQPVMEDLAEAQIDRQAGELADVLDLTDEQLATLEEELRKRKQRLPSGFQAASSRPAREEPEPQTSLEEELPSILTPEQLQKYQEYTEKKIALQAAPSVDREVFELDWRLDLLEDQKAPVQEILKEQDEKMRQLSPASALEGDATPAERLEQHIEQRTALNKETAERMKAVLDEDQFEAFVRYQEERDTETRLLRRLIQEEQAGEEPATP
jgi:hypothetical protein